MTHVALCSRRQHNLQGLRSLGGFRNVRQEFDWEGLVLELDQTRFEHGTVYELEAETVRRVRMRAPVINECINLCLPQQLTLGGCLPGAGGA